MSHRAVRLRALLSALLVCGTASAALAQRVTEIQMAPRSLRMVPDAQTQLSATAYDSSGTPLNVRFRWSSSNVNVVVVDSVGTARAIAPGTALIVAIPLDQPSRGRRRAGQIPVRVILPAAAGAAQLPAGPPTGAATPVIPPTAVQPRPPGYGAVVISPRGMDSLVKASINCDEPMINATNPMRACYDQRPIPRSALSALNVSSCEEQHGGIMLLLRVDSAGSVAEVRPYVTSRCQSVTDSVVSMARALSFQPARREGHPVPAWVRIVVRTGEQPPPPERQPPPPDRQPLPPKP